MKKTMKNLLMMALAVFVGQAFAADPVATWTWDGTGGTLASETVGSYKKTVYSVRGLVLDLSEYNIPAKSFTYSFWTKRTANMWGDYAGFADSYKFVQIEQGRHDAVWFYGAAGGVVQEGVDCGFALSDSEYQMVTIVVDSGTLKVYVNGQLKPMISEKNGTAIIDEGEKYVTCESITIPSSAWPNLYSDGQTMPYFGLGCSPNKSSTDNIRATEVKIADAKVYNKALTADEVLWAYNAAIDSLVAGGEVERAQIINGMTINGTLEASYSGNTYLNESDFSEITGTGKIKIANKSGWVLLPASEKIFPSTLALEVECEAGLILSQAAEYTVGTLSGSKGFRTDWGSGPRSLTIIQSANSEHSGSLLTDHDKSSRFEKFVVKGAEGATEKTLTLSGNTSPDAKPPLEIDASGSVKLTGTWGGKIVVNGRIVGNGTVGGDFELNGGAVIDVSEGGLTVNGAVTVGGTVTVLGEAGQTVLTCNNAAEVAAKLTAPTGLECVVDDGKIVLAKKPVVKIGETTYTTLAEAVAAAQSGDTIVLIENVELAETVMIPVDKTLTIDLNGKSISMEESIVTTAYALNNLGTLTLKDSVGTGSVNARGIYNGYGNGADNVATAKIIIQSGTYNAKGTNGGAAIFNYGIAEINGGSFTSIGGYSLNNQAGSSMTIADGVTANNGIYCSNAKVTVNGGNISGNRSGCHVVYAWNVELTINGGTFYNNNSGNATIMSAGTTKCTITGGTFGIKDGRVEGNGNTWTSCLTDTANTATMTVTGGIFNGGFRVQAGTTMTIEGGSFNDVGGSGYNIYGTASVKGGTFTDTTAQNFAKANLADGFELNVGGNVVEIPAVAQIGETKYATLSEAFAAVQNGETVKLLADVAASETITIAGKSITLDLNGKTISGVCNMSQSCLVYVENNAALTVKDSAGNGKLTYAQGTSNVGWTVDVKGAFVLESGTVELTGSWSIGYAVDVRPNAWGAAYVNPTVFTMNGGNIVSSDGGVRIASSSDSADKNVSASFVMKGGKIDAAWDGVFIQQSDAIYDNLAFEITGGTIESDLNPVRVYGPAPTGYVSGQDCMNIALKGGTLEYTGTESYEWVVDGILRVGGGSSAETIVENGSLSVSGETAADSAAPEGFKWESVSDGMAVLVAKPTAADLPDAEVTNLGSITVGLGDYKADAYMMYDIINGGKLQEATVPYDLTLAMDFKAKDTAEAAAQNAFGGYTTDFFITMSGMSQASFVGNGCYLAGYYPSFKAWVKIPLDGFTVENGKVYPVITSAGFDFKYTDICGTVGQFICGIYLTPEVLAANPNLSVDLTLGLAENKDAALNAEFVKVDNYVYDVDDLVTLPEVVITDIKSRLTDADPDLTFALNFAIKDADKLSEEYLEKLFAKYGDYYTDYVLTISGLTDPNGSVKFNANGNGDGYLAGQYDAWSKSWVTVPFSDVTVKNGQSFYIMEYAAELMGKGGLRLTLKEIAEIVKNFDCGVYFTPEFLAANPNLKVDLELKVFTEDESGNKVGDISVATNTFDKDDFSVEAAKLDIRIVNGKPQIGFAGEGKLVLNAATALIGEWTKNIEYTLVENDGDDTKTWVTPAEGYYFFKGFITK